MAKGEREMKKYNFTHDRDYVKKLVDEDFYNVHSYQELDNKIAALSSEEGNWQEGMAFEGWVEGLINVLEESVETYIHSSKIPQETKDEWRFPVVKNKEYGIDGILYYHNDPMPMPVQIKFQSKKNKIDFAKLATFGLAAQKFPYGRRLVIHNQAKVDDALPKDSYISMGRKDLDGLKSEDFQRINKWLKGVPVEELKKELEYRDYQDDEFVPQMTEGLIEADRVNGVATCGSGKTIMVIKLLLALLKARLLPKASRGLVVVPSIFLIHQWTNNIIRWLTDSVLPVCTPQEMQTEESAVLTTTDEVKIADWLLKNPHGVMIGTLASLPRVSSALKIANIKQLDWGIIDEAHNVTGYLTQRKTFVLRDRHIPIAKRIFITATPLCPESTGTQRVASMDDETWFGKTCYRLTRKEAIDRGIIVKKRIWMSVNVGEEDLDEGQVIFEGEHLRADWVANLLACAHFVSGMKAKVKRCFVYHNSINRSRAFASDGPTGIKYHMKNVWVGRIDGDMSLSTRAMIMKDFREAESKGFDHAFLCLVACGTEGIDEPTADGVWFADPKKAELTINQICGRVERVAGSKNFAEIGMPLHLKDREQETKEEAAKRTGYHELLLSLQLMDGDEEYREIIQMLDQRGGHLLKGYARDILGETFNVTSPNTHDAEEMKKALVTRRIQLGCGEIRSSRGFWEMFESWVETKERTGRSWLPADWPEDQELSTWEMNIRNRIKRYKIPEKHLTALNEENFVLNTKTVEWFESFEKGFEKLEKFIKYLVQHADCPAMPNPEDGDFYLPLFFHGGFMTGLFRGCKSNEHEADPCRVLGWPPSADFNYKVYEEIKAFLVCRRRDSMNVKDNSFDKPLRNHKITAEVAGDYLSKIDKLFNGQAWRNPERSHFENMFARYKACRQDFDGYIVFDCNLDPAEKPNVLKLWETSIRSRANNDGECVEWQLERLLKIGFKLKPVKDEWERKWELVKAFYKEFGGFPKNRTNNGCSKRWLLWEEKNGTTESGLYSWIITQKTTYKECSDKNLPLTVDTGMQYYDLTKLLESHLNILERDLNQEREEADLAMVSRLLAWEKENGDIENLPEDLKTFVATWRSYYRLMQTKNKNGKPFEVTPRHTKVTEEMSKLKNFTWMPSKTVKTPDINEYTQVSSAGNESTTYKFNVTLNGELRTYQRKDLELLKEMRDKVMDAGHHIDFPKSPPYNKGRDNWKKKAEAKKEANKEYWEIHGWNDEKIQILKDNYKELTDKELSEGLLKSHTPKAISGKRKELGLLKKRSDSELIQLKMTTTKPSKGNTRYNIYLGNDCPEGKKKRSFNFSSSNKKLTEKALAFFQERVNDWEGTYQELRDSFVYDKRNDREEIEAEAQELGIPTVTESYGGRKGGNPIELRSLIKKIESVKAGTYKKKRNKKELEARARELGVPTTTQPRGKYGGGQPMDARALAKVIEAAEAGLSPRRNRKELEARALKLGVSIVTDPYNGYSGGEPLHLHHLEKRIKEAENK